MSSYRQLIYHLVFRTRESKPVLDKNNTPELYANIGGIIKNKNSHLYRINGIENHLHILTDLHPSIPLADFMRDIKGSSSHWINNNKVFPLFEGWAESYGAFTCSFMDVGRLTDYIKNQVEHHGKKTFEEEYRYLLMESGIKIDEQYFP